jgi:hypothetical protein
MVDAQNGKGQHSCYTQKDSHARLPIAVPTVLTGLCACVWSDRSLQV